MYANILCILDVLTEDQHTKLKALGTRVRFPADQTLFFEGQPSHSVLLIEDGSVKITKVAPDGTEMILAIRGAGELLGDEGVLMDEPRSATVTTITELSAIDVDADELRRFVREEDLWPTMYKAVVARGRQSDQRTLLGRLDVKYRLARWLLDIAAEVGEQTDEGWAIELLLSQQDIASRIGASRDAVAIELRKLREKGLLSTGRRKIVLHDLATLNRIAAV